MMSLPEALQSFHHWLERNGRYLPLDDLRFKLADLHCQITPETQNWKRRTLYSLMRVLKLMQAFKARVQARRSKAVRTTINMWYRVKDALLELLVLHTPEGVDCQLVQSELRNAASVRLSFNWNGGITIWLHWPFHTMPVHIRALLKKY